MKYKVPKCCKICNKETKNMLYKGKKGGGIYLNQRFWWHIEKNHEMSIDEYLETFENVKIEKCPCGVCNKKLKINKKGGSGFVLSKYACGRTEGTMKWSEKAKKTRSGKNNPMYGRKPWNLGLDVSDKRVKQISEKAKGKKHSLKTRKKQSESAKRRKIHGHTGKKHSPESKKKMRDKTLERISNGEFKQTKSEPHIKMCSILKQMGLIIEEEKIIKYYSFDIYLPEYDIYIEVDGDYFHSNPKFYPNGPITKTQIKNSHNDNRKNTFCKTMNMTLARFWENDILNNEDFVICELQKLLG